MSLTNIVNACIEPLVPGAVYSSCYKCKEELIVSFQKNCHLPEEYIEHPLNVGVRKTSAFLTGALAEFATLGIIASAIIYPTEEPAALIAGSIAAREVIYHGANICRDYMGRKR